jgi:hypothetical protein
MTLASSRVQKHTAPHVKAHIYQKAERNIEELKNSDRSLIRHRVAELAREWDVERGLMLSFVGATLLGAGLGAFVHRKWLILPTVASGFMLQHLFHGWCPPLPILRRLGFRTHAEIEHEREMLLREIEARKGQAAPVRT